MSRFHTLYSEKIVPELTKKFGYKSIMEEEKPNQKEKPAFRDERITKLIPKTVPRGQETDFVVKALEFYNRHLQRNKAHER